MSTIKPTRVLKSPEKKVFDRAVMSFASLRPEDAELMTAYAEQSHRYGVAKYATERKPTIPAPIFSRSDGKQIGERPVRNPAFANMREALNQIRFLERRLTTLNDKRRAEAERGERRKAKPKPLPSWSSEQARATAAHELQELVEDEMRASTFEPTEEKIAEIGQELIKTGYQPCVGERDCELRTVTLSWIESRYWAARPPGSTLPKSAGQTFVENELDATSLYDDLFYRPGEIIN